TNAESQRQCRNHREHWIFQQRTTAEPQVLPCGIEPMPAPKIARLLAEVKHVSKARGLAERFGKHFTVCFHLAFEFDFEASAVQQTPDAAAPFSEVHFVASYADSSSPSMACVTRRYSAISASSCFLPLAVMRYSRTWRPLSEVTQPRFTQPLSSNFCS